MSPSTDHRESREFASELKFLVLPQIAEQIRDWAAAHLQPDPHCSNARGDGYEIDSLYFDTKQFDVFHKNGSYGRSKYRVRRYGGGNVVFLERKLRTRGLVSKRRTEIELGALERFSRLEHWAGTWFERRLSVRRLKPVCQIGYRRTARVQMTKNGPIRLTIDQDLRSRWVEEVCFGEPAKRTQILANQAVLELKYRLEMPVIFKLLAEEFALSPQPFSKYRQAAKALGLAKEMAENVASDTTCSYA